MRSAPILLLALAACAAPDLDLPGEAAAQRAETPRLLPFEQILAPPPTPPEDAATLRATLDARAAALRGRAAALPAAPTDSAGLDARTARLRDRAAALADRSAADTASDEDRSRLDELRNRVDELR